MKKNIAFLLLLSASCLVLSLSAQTVHNVPGTYTSISAAITASANGDIIEIAAGTYTESGLTVDKSLTFRGAGRSSTIIQAAASPNTALDRIFQVTQGLTVRFEKMTLRNGYARTGALSSSGHGGGAIDFDRSSFTIEEVDFVDNRCLTTADLDGGAISMEGQNIGGTTCKIKNCIFQRNEVGRANTSPDGGAIYLRGDAGSPDLVLDSCEFYSNYAGDRGGAIYAATSELKVVISNSYFFDNEAGDDAGALGLEKFSITSSTFEQNSCLDEGGAIRINSGSNETITNCTFYNNQGGDGGAIKILINLPGSITLTNNTIYNNFAFSSGAGIYIENGGPSTGFVNLSNNILVGNNMGSDIVNDGIIGINAYNIVEGCSGTCPAFAGSILRGIGTFGYNGGFTKTLALTNLSNAINIGTTGAPAVDQRGYARVGAPDIGAYEFGASPTPLTAVCQNRTINLCAGGSATLNPADLNNGSSGGTAPLGFTASKTSFSFSDVGPNAVTLTVSDASGNTSTCSASVTITVLSKPIITAVPAQDPVCSGENISIPILDGTGTLIPSALVEDVDVSVTVAGGLTVVSGPTTGAGLTNGAITGDVYDNYTSGPLNVTYTITPNGPLPQNCPGDPIIVTVTINPEPIMTAGLEETVCANAESDITLSISNGLPGVTTYYWNGPGNPALDAGLTTGNVSRSGPPGNAANIKDTYKNPMLTQLNATYTITPVSAAGCAGDAETVVIKVNPFPVLADGLADTICSGSTTNIALSVSNTSINAVTFTWPAPTPSSTGLMGPVVGNSISVPFVSGQPFIRDQWTNITNAPQYAEYYVYPIGDAATGGCIGDPDTVTVFVDHEPVLKSNWPDPICSIDPTVDLNLVSPTLLNPLGNPSNPMILFTAVWERLMGSGWTVVSGVQTVSNGDQFRYTYTFEPTLLGTPPRQISLGNGCFTTLTETVIVNPAPRALAQQGCGNCGEIRSTICQFDPAPDLQAYVLSNSNYEAGTTLNWYADNNRSQGSPISTPVVNPNQAGTNFYWVDQEKANCPSPAIRVRVRVKKQFAPEFNLPAIGCGAGQGQVDLAAWVSDPKNKTTRYTFYDVDPVANPGATPIGSATATNGVVNFGQYVIVNIAFGSQTYWVQNTVPNGCGSTASSTLIANSVSSTLTFIPDQTVASGTPVSITFSGTNATHFLWLDHVSFSNPNIGIVGSLGLNTLTFTAYNPTASPLTASIRAISYNGNCAGQVQDFDITVNPGPPTRQAQNQLQLFASMVNTHDVQLNWQIVSDQELIRFEIEKKRNEGDFEAIGYQDWAGSGAYQYLDKTGMGNANVYRLKLIYTDGRVVWSDEVQVNMDFSDNHRFDLFPNPTAGLFQVKALFPMEASYRWQLSDVMGKTLMKGNMEAQETTIQIESLVTGIYHLVMISPEGKRYLMKVVKQ